MRVTGLDAVPPTGGVLVVPNHDSQWDPVVVGLALRRRRQLRFLARSSLWKIPGLGPVLYGAGQIPIERGSGDVGALWKAVEALRDGAAVCVFPEGKLSNGERLRARTGVARLAAEAPGTSVVLCGVGGKTDYARSPPRPRVTVALFEPGGGQPRQDEDPQEPAPRLLDEVRAHAPPTQAGR